MGAAMPLDLDQHQELTEFFTDINEHSHKLTNWELGFTNDMKDRFQKYGGNTIISEKQWEIVRRIQNKIYQIG